MSLHHHHQRLHQAAAKRDIITSDGLLVSVVYVTASPTFTGVIGGYSTVTAASSSATLTSSAARSIAANTLVSASTASSTSASGSGSHTSSGSLISSTVASNATSPLYPTSSTYATDFSVATSTASATSSSSDSSSDGMPVGAKLGIAVGIIFVIGVFTIFPLIMLARKRRRSRQQDHTEAEKTRDMDRPATRQSTNPDAPRLSLRPVSSLVPEFMGGAKSKARSSRDLLTPITEVSKSGRTPSPAIALVDRPRTGDNPFGDPENPFADPEKGTANGPIPWRHVPADAAGEYAPPPTAAEIPGIVNTEPTADAFPIPQPRVQSMNMSARALSPDGSSGAAEVAELPGAPPPSVAFGPGSGPPQSNVYRIVMDFRPTMDDELGLRNGQLVRLLHEYDDGWALCIRLDRSQQGVVPRSCLAAKPSKPRPGPGPGPLGPGGRPLTPQGQARGAGPRPQGPNQGTPRAQAPTSARSPSPVASRGPGIAPIRSQSPAPVSSPVVEPVRSQSPAPTRALIPEPVRAASPAPIRAVEVAPIQAQSPALGGGQGADAMWGQGPPVTTVRTPTMTSTTGRSLTMTSMTGRTPTMTSMTGRSPTMTSTTGAFNQPPRPLSPGPRPGQQVRGMSPIPNAPAPSSRPTSSAGPGSRIKPNLPPAGSMPSPSAGMAM